jgi:hypothetical protein
MNNKKKELKNDYNFNKANKFQEVIEKKYSDTLIQDILNLNKLLMVIVNY